MAFIATVGPRAARGETAEAYATMRGIAGSDLIAKIVQLFSLQPASMRRMIRTWELLMWSGDAPRADREFVAVAVSRYNDCHY